MPELTWLEGSCLKKSTSPISAPTGLRRCGQIFRPITTPPDKIVFGRHPVDRRLPLTGDVIAMDAKEFFARHETTGREICQQRKKKHAVRAQTPAKSTVRKFRVGDLVLVLRPRPLGTHCTKTWSKPR